MDKKVKAMLASYGRSVLGAALATISVIGNQSGLSPIEFGSAEWAQVANALWAAAVPVLLRYANKKDPAFGLVAEQVTKGITKKVTKRK